MPECLTQFPSPTWLNAWAIGLNREKWQLEGLFQPTTAPRDLSSVRQQMRSLFRFDEH
jgi:hypothetical protein